MNRFHARFCLCRKRTEKGQPRVPSADKSDGGMFFSKIPIFFKKGIDKREEI